MNYAKTVIGHWGAKRAADLDLAGCDHRREVVPDSPRPEGFVDASEILFCGIYILILRGEVVHIGKSGSAMLAKIAAMRESDRPKCLAAVSFDEVLIRRVHPDKIKSLYQELTATYLTKPTSVSCNTQTFGRRI